MIEGGNCGHFDVSNTGTRSSSSWTVSFTLNPTSVGIAGQWNFNNQQTLGAGRFTFTNLSWNGVIAPNGHYISSGMCLTAAATVTATVTLV